MHTHCALSPTCWSCLLGDKRLPQHLLGQVQRLVHTADVHTSLQAVGEGAQPTPTSIDLALQHNLAAAGEGWAMCSTA